MATGTTRAARFTADRGRYCLILSALVVIWTSILIARVVTDAVGWIDVTAWAAWLLAATVWTFGSPGLSKRWSGRERSIINDELARDHQRSAAFAAMGVLMVAVAMGCFEALGAVDLPGWWPVAGLGSGVAASGLRFGWLQLRS